MAASHAWLKPHLWRHEAICEFQLLDPAQMRLHSLGAHSDAKPGATVAHLHESTLLLSTNKNTESSV